MNRDCNGDFYELRRTRWYRCLLNGRVIKASRVGATCPECHRPIAATDNGKVETRLYVRLGDLGFVVHPEVQP